MVRLLYYIPSTCKALPQGFQSASSPSTCAARLSPSSAFYLRVPSLNISLPREAATDRETVQLTRLIAALFTYGLVSPLPLFPIQKGGQS